MENNTFPILDNVFVENLIPQKTPFILVDKLLYFEENNIIGGLSITENLIFLKENNLQEPGLIEHMAQTVALYTGYQYFLKNETAPVGYIGSIKTVEIFQLPKLNDKIETEVTVLQEFMGVTLVDISSKINNIEIARAQMKTVIAN